MDFSVWVLANVLCKFRVELKFQKQRVDIFIQLCNLYIWAGKPTLPAGYFSNWFCNFLPQSSNYGTSDLCSKLHKGEKNKLASLHHLVATEKVHKGKIIGDKVWLSSRDEKSAGWPNHKHRCLGSKLD